MKKLILGVFFVLAVVVLTAKEKKEDSAVKVEKPVPVALSGTVVDENTGELLTGVEVKIKSTGKKTYTDFDGNFSFESVKPGKHDLVVKFISYNEEIKSHKVSAKNNTVKIHLKLQD